ncbi:MAG: competence/damage-inducible protein A [Lachnospiraceae bacterium]|nr:competence/damage-inducible protein A [Lachnospiraceae bacterium]
MVVELISVGTEILMGNIVNTNAAYLAEQCNVMGLVCYYQTTVGDNEKRLTETIKTAMSRADLIILSGGLGPTKDDLTKEICAKVCKKELVEDKASKEAIKDFFQKRGKKPTENNWKQAMVPKGCIVLDNPNGTAPGIIMEEEKNTLILLPGPPNELVPMFADKVIPYLKSKQEAVMVSQTVKIVGVGESSVAAQIDDLFEKQTNPTIATYAKVGEVHLRVTARAEDEKKARKLLKPMIKELKNRFSEHVFTTDPDVTLEQSIVDLLVDNDLTVSTVESCTGGLVAGRLINVPGVSEVFKMGHITYSNKAKRKIIGVKRSTLDKYGAVSEQVAAEMAKGGFGMTKADVTVSVTGIAGPDGGTAEKPVGLVYIGCCVKGKVTVKKYNFSGSRAKIREATVSAALVLMRECVLAYVSEMAFGKKK